MRSFAPLALLPLLAAASPLSIGTIHKDAAPILSSVNTKEIPNSYMVVLKKHALASKHHDWVQGIHLASQKERTELRKRSQFPITTEIFEGLKHTYDIAGSLLGYSGHFDDETIEQIRRHPDVSTDHSSHHTHFVIKAATVSVASSPLSKLEMLCELEGSLEISPAYLRPCSATTHVTVHPS
jgi:cerevisin